MSNTIMFFGLVLLHCVCLLPLVTAFSSGDLIANGRPLIRNLFCMRPPLHRAPFHMNTTKCNGYCQASLQTRDKYSVSVSDSSYWDGVLNVTIGSVPGSPYVLKGFAVSAVNEEGTVVGLFTPTEDVTVAVCNQGTDVEGSTAFHTTSQHKRTDVTLQWKGPGQNYNEIKFRIWIVHSHDVIFYMESEPIHSLHDGSSRVDLQSLLKKLLRSKAPPGGLALNIFEKSFHLRRNKGFRHDVKDPFKKFRRLPRPEDLIPEGSTSLLDGADVSRPASSKGPSAPDTATDVTIGGQTANKSLDCSGSSSDSHCSNLTASLPTNTADDNRTHRPTTTPSAWTSTVAAGKPTVDTVNNMAAGIPTVDTANTVADGIPTMDTANDIADGIPTVDTANTVADGIPTMDTANTVADGIPTVDIANDIADGIPTLDTANDIADGISAVDTANTTSVDLNTENKPLSNAVDTTVQKTSNNDNSFTTTTDNSPLTTPLPVVDVGKERSTSVNDTNTNPDDVNDRKISANGIKSTDSKPVENTGTSADKDCNMVTAGCPGAKEELTDSDIFGNGILLRESAVVDEQKKSGPRMLFNEADPATRNVHEPIIIQGPQRVRPPQRNGVPPFGIGQPGGFSPFANGRQGVGSPLPNGQPGGTSPFGNGQPGGFSSFPNGQPGIPPFGNGQPGGMPPFGNGQLSGSLPFGNGQQNGVPPAGNGLPTSVPFMNTGQPAFSNGQPGAVPGGVPALGTTQPAGSRPFAGQSFGTSQIGAASPNVRPSVGSGLSGNSQPSNGSPTENSQSNATPTSGNSQPSSGSPSRNAQPNGGSPSGNAQPGSGSPFGNAQPGVGSPFGSAQPGSRTLPFGNAQPGGSLPFGSAQPGGRTLPFGNAQPGGSLPFGSAQPGGRSLAFGNAQPGGRSLPFGSTQPGGSLPFGNAQPGGRSLPFGNAQPGVGSPFGNAQSPFGSMQPNGIQPFGNSLPGMTPFNNGQSGGFGNPLLTRASPFGNMQPGGNSPFGMNSPPGGRMFPSSFPPNPFTSGPPGMNPLNGMRSGGFDPFGSRLNPFGGTSNNFMAGRNPFTSGLGFPGAPPNMFGASPASGLLGMMRNMFGQIPPGMSRSRGIGGPPFGFGGVLDSFLSPFPRPGMPTRFSSTRRGGK